MFVDFHKHYQNIACKLKPRQKPVEKLKLTQCGSFLPELTLCQLLSFVVKRVHHFAHVLYRFQRSFVGLVHHRLLKDDQHTFSLVQDTWDDEGNPYQPLSLLHLKGNKQPHVPWNFSSKIICDNFLSTSP